MRYVRNVLSSWVIWLYAITSALFWSIAPHFDPISVVTVIEAAVFPAAIWVVVTFGIRVVQITLRGEAPDASDVLMTGICTAWLSNAGLRLWDTVYRLDGSHEEMLNHYFVSYLLCGYIVASMLHVGSSGSIGGTIPRRAWIFAGGVVAFGAALGLILIWLESNQQWLWFMRGSGPD